MIAICALLAKAKAASPAPNSQLPASAAQPIYYDAATAAKVLAAKEARPRARFDAKILPTAGARSLVTGGPIVTPCGRACHMAVVVFTRLAQPNRTMVLTYLPCTRMQVLDQLRVWHCLGLLAAQERAALDATTKQLGKHLRCGEKLDKE